MILLSRGKNNILLTRAALVRKILFSPLENKIHIFAPPCNILYIYLTCAFAKPVKIMGAEWYLENRGSQKLLIQSQNLRSLRDGSQSLVFLWFFPCQSLGLSAAVFSALSLYLRFSNKVQTH